MAEPAKAGDDLVENEQNTVPSQMVRRRWR